MKISGCFRLALALLPAVARAFSALSSFTRTRTLSKLATVASFKQHHHQLTMYDSSSDNPPNSNTNAWSVLATTEQWISATLANSQASNNPYVRKEVSYQCETHVDAAMILSGIFRRIKEAREFGQAHGRAELERAKQCHDGSYAPRTYRETLVVVIPGNKEFCDHFGLFDTMVETIHQARRNARDYMTLMNVNNDNNDNDLPWSVSVNCAHMHPNFGTLAQEELRQRNDPTSHDPVDIPHEAYKQNKILARQSPYPSLVLEVRAVPPPYFGEPTKESSSTTANVQQLEALFSKSAYTGTKAQTNSEDAFWDAVGDNLPEISTVTPLDRAVQWMTHHDPKIDGSGKSSAFTEFGGDQVDAAYEFVFTNLAMRSSQNELQRQYLVLPNFMTHSATSLEKAASDLIQMISVLPGYHDVTMETFHPEHVNAALRSPMPVFVLAKKV